MALNSRSVLHPKWLTHNVPVGDSFQLATIEIFDPKGSDSTYNAVNNTWSSARTVLWTGKARIQVSRNATNATSTINPSTVQMFEVHIDLRGNTLEGAVGTMPDIRPNHQVFVTASPYDEALKYYIFTVTGALSSSNPWGKMLQCEVDQEVKRVISS